LAFTNELTDACANHVHTDDWTVFLANKFYEPGGA
jgi:hypothetical protein